MLNVPQLCWRRKDQQIKNIQIWKIHLSGVPLDRYDICTMDTKVSYWMICRVDEDRVHRRDENISFVVVQRKYPNRLDIGAGLLAPPPVKKICLTVFEKCTKG